MEGQSEVSRIWIGRDWRGLYSFIAEAVRARLSPDARALDAAYRAARKERWRKRLIDDWRHTETEVWPE